LSIAAALAAPFLRPLGTDSFGINWFSDTSDGKTLCLVAAASVAGLVGAEGLPSWADSQAGIEVLARGHRDNVMPLDDSGDGEHQMPLEKKSQMIAFLIARNRPRKLSRTYERNHNLANREFKIILLSSSERALGQIACAANARRLGGEEVRFIDIPASEPGSSGVFDGNITSSPGRSLRQTTKELVESLKAHAIKHQGHALRALLMRYVNDPQGLDELKEYKQQFERKAAICDGHNAHYRVRSNFAVIYAAAALAIDYAILPWGKRSTFCAIEKCMRLALAALQTGKSEPTSGARAADLHQLGKTLAEQLARARILPVKLKRKVTKRQARARRKADGFKINGNIYVKPVRFKQWIPTQLERDALKGHKIIVTERTDTATIEKKIGGIHGKPRYYLIDVRALRLLTSH
jgi:putative DNA primase/helicase